MSDNHAKTKRYRKLQLFLMDYPERTGPLQPLQASNENEPKHRFLCRRIEEVFTQLFDVEVVRLYLPDDFSEHDFLNDLEARLRSKTEDDMIFFCYQGKAAGKNKHYSWKLNKASPRSFVNACAVIQMFCECNADSLVILDCEFYDNLETKFRRTHGTTEIIYSGGIERNLEGVDTEQSSDTLTAAIYACLLRWANGIDNPRKAKAMRTLRQIIQDDKDPASKAKNLLIQGTACDVKLHAKVGKSKKPGFKLEFFGDITPVRKRQRDIDDDGEDDPNSMFC